jgi:hypothetical protein
MNKFLAILQLVGAAVLALVGVATVVNMVLIAQRPETISVINALIAQILLIGVLAAATHILARRGLARLRSAEPTDDPQSGESAES